MKTVFALILVIFAGAAFADEYWTEEVVVADGQTIVVNRSVEYACRGKVPWEAHRKYPCLYRLNFEHPRLTFTDIRWEGTKHINPIALQVINDIPYLAIYSNTSASPIQGNSQIYGCPEVPFSFLKYDLKRREWAPIEPMAAPEALLMANLIPRYESYYMGKGKLDKDEVALAVKGQLVGASGYLQAKIPRNAEEWSYRLKRSFLTSRVQNDCRPPLEKVVDVIFPPKADGKTLDLDPAKIRNVDYEIIEDKRFEPPLLVPEAERHTLWFDKETAEKCNAYFLPSDNYDNRLMTYKGFVSDSTRKKFTGNGLNNLYCSDKYNYGIWNRLDIDFIVLAKYTKSGEVLSYLKFQKPKRDMWTIDSRSRIENDFLYFVLAETTWKEGVRGTLFTQWLTVRVKVE